MSANHTVLLHNIRSTQNVGAIFRTADALGVGKIWLTGYTPRPLDRFGRPDTKIAKTALGAELTTPWDYRKDPVALLARLKKEGGVVVGVEQDKRAVDYKTYAPGKDEKTVLVMGNEVRGLSKSLRGKCAFLLELPMKGKKESLNVSVAFGIVAYQIWDR